MSKAYRFILKGHEGKRFKTPDKTEYLIRPDGSLRNMSNPRPRMRRKERIKQRRLEREA